MFAQRSKAVSDLIPTEVCTQTILSVRDKGRGTISTLSTKSITVLNALFLMAYLMSAAVQYNDPDALPWIILYLTAAAMCVAQYRKNLPRWLPLLLLFISLVWIGWLLPNVVGQVTLGELVESISMRTEQIEEAREIGGLLLVTIWSAMLVQWRNR
ncbi:MAG: transmembrane 220 family protein [Pseudomonadota bacterium]